MKRIFIIGDHKTGTGPANVTKQYIKYFPKGTLYQKRTSKAGRLPELLIKALRSDILLFSGYSYQNVLGMALAKRLHKKTAYVVHGAITHENSINHAQDYNMSEVEDKTLELADRLVCVSKKFADWMKDEYPQYKDKICYVMNGVDNIDKEIGLHNSESSDKRNPHDILSIGGGMPRKRILYICRALEILNKEENGKYTLHVIGKDGYDTEEINKFDFVKNYGLVDAGKKEELFNSCPLFIQNSCFETFGLAPVEALTHGMSILTSSVCGVLDLFPDAKDEDIINDCEDINEIAGKIKHLSSNPNNSRMLNSLIPDNVSWEKRCSELYDILMSL